MPPEYDFRSKFAVNNSLPNPRLVSNVVHGSLVSPADYKHTVALMQWGQILDHDITLTPMIRERDGSLSDCQSCHSDPQKCSPISIPHNDPHFPSIDIKVRLNDCVEKIFYYFAALLFSIKKRGKIQTELIDVSCYY